MRPLLCANWEFKYQGNVVSANRRNTISNTDEINRLLGAQKIATFTDNNNYQSTSTKIHRNLIPVFTQPEIKVLSLQPNQRFLLKKQYHILTHRKATRRPLQASYTVYLSQKYEKVSK